MDSVRTSRRNSTGNSSTAEDYLLESRRMGCVFRRRVGSVWVEGKCVCVREGFAVLREVRFGRSGCVGSG